MKKFLALFITSVLVVSMFAACSGGGTQPAANDSGSATTANNTSGNNESAAAAPAGDGVTLEFWDMNWGPVDTYYPAVQANIDRFNAENGQGITVRQQMTPWDNFYQVFLTAVTAGAAPDVSTGAGGQPVQYAAMGESLDLDPILEAWEGDPILEDFIPGLLDYYNWEGTQWGIPWNIDPRGFTYRKDFFEEAGITSMPKTFDEFADVLRTLKAKFPDKIPLVFTAGDHGAMQVAFGFLIYNGSGFVDADKNANMESPEAMEVWKYLQMLCEEELIGAGVAGYKGSDVEPLFTTGEAIIYWGSPPTFLAGTDTYDKVGVMPPIAGPNAGDKASNYFWINGIQGYNQTEHPDEARTFIKWWAENTLTLFTEGGAGPSPTRASLYEDTFFQTNWLKKGFYDNAINGGVPVIWPVSGLYPAFLQIEGEGYPGNVLRHIASGGSDFEEYLARQNDMIRQAVAEDQ